MSIKVAIFDHNRNVRNSIIFLLGSDPSFNIVGSYANTWNCVKHVLSTEVDVVLMDIQMPCLKGIETIKCLKKAIPQINILIQTAVEDNDQIYDAIVAGASGYILKRYLSRGLVEAIKNLYRGGAPMSPPIARKVLHLLRHQSVLNSKRAHINGYNLTLREKDVLACIVNGFDYKMVSFKLNISRETVRSHIKNIYGKLSVASLTEAVAKCIHYDLVPQQEMGPNYGS